MAKYILTTGHDSGSAADSPIHSGNCGIDNSTSTTRCTASSTKPPK